MKRGLILGLLVVAFLAPVLVAVLLQSELIDWRPEPTAQHGVLVEPPVSLPPTFELATADGGTLKAEALSGKWVIAYSADTPCRGSCRAYLDALRRGQRGLGRHADRAMRLVLVERHDNLGSLAGQQSTRIAAVEGTEVRARLVQATGGDPTGETLLIDPRGYIVLRYPDGTEAAHARHVLADLERLLTWSKPGQQ